MNKSAIKTFSVEARRKLLQQAAKKADYYGITEDNIDPVSGESEDGIVIGDMVHNKRIKKQREDLVRRVKEIGYAQLIEEVAYTWFNRFIALRFMEVNDYLPAGVRVLSSITPGKTDPDIISGALTVDLPLDKEIIYQFQDSNDTESLYKYLLITQCNALNEILPFLFEKIEDYTELLLPDNLLFSDSVIKKLIGEIPEEDWKEVEIIGWLYQFYISEKKDEVFANLKKNIKISKENIPAATQLFTPAWIVKYMVENSVGRLWLEAHPDKELQEKWKYYIEPAEQEPEVQKELDEIIDKNITPEDIAVLDPCMGSGHILVYAFEVLYEIYKSAGYTEKEIPRLILTKNLYGLEIDDRAAQLACFAVMMKARSYSRRVFREDINLNLCAIEEFQTEYDADSLQGYPVLRELCEKFIDGKEYGSLIEIDDTNNSCSGEACLATTGDMFSEKPKWEVIIEEFEGFKRECDVFSFYLAERVERILKQAGVMGRKYDVVVTNPPYMGGKGMSVKVSEYVKKRFPDSKSDLFACFIERGFELIKRGKFNTMVTMQSWMFLSSFEKMRLNLLDRSTVVTMVHMANMVLGIAFGTAATVFRTMSLPSYKGSYSYTELKDINYNGEPFEFPVKNERLKGVAIRDFYKIPGSPVAYWVSDKIKKIFNNALLLGTIVQPKTGMTTANNDRFVRFWFEINFKKIGFNLKDKNLAKQSKLKWFPYNKGGGYRKWKGFNEYLINWENDGFEIKNCKDERGKKLASVRNEEKYFSEGITWSTVTSGKFSSRIVDKGYLFDSGGSSLFPSTKEDMYYIQALLSSPLTEEIISLMSETINYQPGDIARIPVIFTNNEGIRIIINQLVEENISISRTDWDSFETSWDFRVHPFLTPLTPDPSPPGRGEVGGPAAGGSAEEMGGGHFSEVSVCDRSFSGIKENSKDYMLSPLLPGEKGPGDEGRIRRRIEDAFNSWKSFTDSRFSRLKANEEELNRLFIEIYGLQDEMTPEVEDKDITIRKADMERDVRSFVSYAVGCMMGRYSLDTPGLAYAGGVFDESKYKTYPVDDDGIIPVLSEDYFEDDIVARFIEFVTVTFGKDTLHENLEFIAGALGKTPNETATERIRKYFLNDFYKDHVRIYKKRPLYWLFTSGKLKAFNALIYIHRHDRGMVAKMRTDYLHELQGKLEIFGRALLERLPQIKDPREKKVAEKKLSEMGAHKEELKKYDELMRHTADMQIDIDLDDGVAVNYEKFKGLVAKI